MTASVWTRLDNGLSVLFFPGTVAHEYAHALAFEARGYTVEMTLFDLFADRRGSYVRPDRPVDPTTWILMALAPWILLTPLAVALAWVTTQVPFPVWLLTAYLTVALLAQAAPSDTDLSPPPHATPESAVGRRGLQAARWLFDWGHSFVVVPVVIFWMLRAQGVL
ncbi:metalloprotease family protein [Halococcoides cellulosivorans]|uniref:DUF3267 domain-containing protein n=1 Tax=Halococcoides cellulosivorans TaxID=1679096 RepID=A0A2R4X2C8_9EURY|nr:metalloprotease family protein [Halococcoides cellulosivorans]AWB27960.1 hypothetical protein HARCEL1_09680 [Halococcoides cellulosivorans]